MADPEHLAKLKQGVKVWNGWREESPDISPNLKGADLQEGFLQRVSLNGADLSAADMRGSSTLLCHFQEARFAETRLDEIQMQGSDLSSAEFSDASLRQASLRECMLNGTRFTRCDLEGADLRKTMVTHAVFEQVRTEGTLYYGVAPWSGESGEKDWAKVLPTFDGE